MPISLPFEEALIHFFGDEAARILRVPIRNCGIELGSHLINHHADSLGFAVTGLTARAARLANE